MIMKFDGEYAFLSNFYPSRILIDPEDGLYAPTVEHAFQSMKTRSMEETLDILAAETPGQAKRLGRLCDLRPDWELVKDNAMLTCLRLKFADPDLREKLLATGNEILVEGTTWHDRYWGICSCVQCKGAGQNKLGQLLMKVREECRYEI